MTKRAAIVPVAVLMPLLMAQDSDQGFVRIAADELDWTLRANGTAVVLLEGDPQSEGFYIQRIRFPPGAGTRPHYHDQDRYVTVLAGTWYTGIGRDWDRDDTVPLGPGSYMKHPAGGVHYDGAGDEEVIVEIRGMGPVQTIFLED